jgi:phosphonate transport system substrate-binding protein
VWYLSQLLLERRATRRKPQKFKDPLEMKLLKRCTALLAIGSLFVFASCEKQPDRDPEPSASASSVALTFGVYTADKPSAVVAQFRPLLDQLELAVGQQLNQAVEIKLDIAATYEKGIENVATGTVDFARLGPASYILAKQQNNELSIAAIESKKGEKVFYGVIAVHQQSEIDSIEDLKGKRFAFGNEKSTIGRYLSQQLLQEHGISASDLESYEYLGRHDAVGAAVGGGFYDAGALKESTFKKLVAKGTPIRVIAKFPNVTKPWVVAAKNDPQINAAIKNALLSIDHPEALKALGKQGFLEGSDADYTKIRESMDRNGDFFNR